MACLDTYKSPDQKGHYPPMSPRLSFSNDFVQSTINQDTIKKTPPNISSASDDDHHFEFSAVTNNQNHTMTAADELFFKGKLLPTLRDELLLHDDDDELVSSPPLFVPPKGLPKWKDFLALNRFNNNQVKMPKLAFDDNPTSSEHMNA